MTVTELRLVIIEDDPHDAELMTEALRRGGLDVSWVRVDTPEAFSSALDTEPDLILADNAVPTFGAGPALRLVEEAGSDVPLVVVSGTLPDEEGLELVRQGAADYVLKDRMARLPEAVAAAVERRALRRERQEAEHLLREAEEKYRALVERIPAITYIDLIDPDAGDRTGVVYLSPQLEDMLGYEPSEIMRDPDAWSRIVHPEDRDAADAMDSQHYRSGAPLDQEYRLVARDGRVVWVRDLATVVTDAHGSRFSQGVIFDITEQRKNEAVLRASSERIRRLFAGLVEVQERERASLASDIHDDSIQMMTAVGMRLGTLRRRVDDPEALRSLDELEHTVDESIRRLRRLLFDLRPRALDEEGLGAALQQHLARLRGDVETSLSYQPAVEPSPQMRAVLYRVAQEAIANARKHATPSRLAISVTSKDDGILLRVDDDGRGFDAEEIQESPPGHVGLSSMRERAEMAGGWLRVSSKPGTGTVVECWVPDVGPDAGSASSRA